MPMMPTQIWCVYCISIDIDIDIDRYRYGMCVSLCVYCVCQGHEVAPPIACHTCRVVLTTLLSQRQEPRRTHHSIEGVTSCRFQCTRSSYQSHTLNQLLDPSPTQSTLIHGHPFPSPPFHCKPQTGTATGRLSCRDPNLQGVAGGELR